MKRRLSSLQTVLAKIVVPILWIGCWGAGTIGALFTTHPSRNSAPALLLLSTWIIGAALLYWKFIHLKKVSVDENFLYASNYLKEISIPLSEVYDVTENRWLSLNPLTIHLKSPSAFGDQITFMPKVRLALFSSHPVVGELKELARAKGARLNTVR
jgi:hypothetical protein